MLALKEAGFSSPRSFIGGTGIYDENGNIDGKVDAFDPYGWD